jgi:starch synthase
MSESISNNLDNNRVTYLLKEILNNNRSLYEFNQWIQNTKDILYHNNITLPNYINQISLLKDEKFSNIFFKNCYNLFKMKNNNISFAHLPDDAKNLLFSNILGPICFLTPELGRWSTVGGLGVMVDELSQGLKKIGQEIIMISPYYDRNRKNEQNYLQNDPFNIKYIKNIEVSLDGTYTFGIHQGEGNGGIKYYFIHNPRIFPRTYPDGSATDKVRCISLFAKACLQLLCEIQVIPEIIVTNDWFTGLAAAYGKNGSFGDVFKKTIFFHIIHNLEWTYEGRIYPNNSEGTLERVHQLPVNYLINPNWGQRVINPSRCAIMISDQRATVSNSYKEEIKNNSALKDILNLKPNPFSHPNGILKFRRLKLMEDVKMTRDECKAYIQKKYLNYKEPDFFAPIISFVGRITPQKGVMMILNIAEEIINKNNKRVNFIIGGMGDNREGYVRDCINKINYLKNKYPSCFWANPNEFFTDGTKINMGSDFGIMPSQFEPGGIVQHEFFSAGTPVIAFRTGGLKDTVFEFNKDNQSGNGFTFDSYNNGELIKAVQRAIDLFNNNKDLYEVCRENALKSVIDVENVAHAYCKEFYRLRNKIYFNKSEVFEDEKKNNFNNNKNNNNNNNNSDNVGNYHHYKNLKNSLIFFFYCLY